MPHKGYRQSDEHIQNRWESIRERVLAEWDAEHGVSPFSYGLMLGQDERRAQHRKYLDEQYRLFAETERLLDSVRIEDSAIERFRRELLRDVRAFISKGKDDNMRDAATTPYVSETQTRHIPMTGEHDHDHASNEDTDHDDGIHRGRHRHDGDADHDHPEQHPHSHAGGERPGRVSGPGQDVRAHEGSYGRQMNAIGPLERKRLKDRQLREQEARNMGQQ